MSRSAAVVGLLSILVSFASAGALQPVARDLPAPLPPALPVVPGLNSDFLDDLSAEDFAAAAHDHDARYYTQDQADTRFAPTAHGHDERYYTQDQADTRFAPTAHGHDARYYTQDQADTRFAPTAHGHDGAYLPIAGKAADSNLLDGLDSTAFLRSGADGAIQGDLVVQGDLSTDQLAVGGKRLVFARVVLGSFATLGYSVPPDGAMRFDTVTATPAQESIRVAVRLTNPGAAVTATISGHVNDELIIGVNDGSNTGGASIAGLGPFSGKTFTIHPGTNTYWFKAKNLGGDTILSINPGWIPPGVEPAFPA